MDSMYAQPLVEMGVSLTELAIKGTATAVTNKIKAIKDEKNAEKLRNTYDDIEHLHNTVSRLLGIIKAFQLASATAKGEEEIAKVTAQVESYEQIKELISVDTLKTMQLLGFNYKAAIGEPLTEICANAIANIGNKGKNAQSNNQQKNRGR